MMWSGFARTGKYGTCANFSFSAVYISLVIHIQARFRWMPGSKFARSNIFETIYSFILI